MIKGAIQYKDTWASPGSTLYEMVKNKRRNLEEDRQLKPRWTPTTDKEASTHYGTVIHRSKELMDDTTDRRLCEDPKCCKPQ